MELHATSPEGAHQHLHLQHKLEAAMILKGVVRIVTKDGQVEAAPRKLYQKDGTPYLEARRRDSGERMVLRLDEIRDVTPY